jgi:pathogenesis-related protein 1
VGAITQPRFGIVVCIGCLAWMAAAMIAQSEELAVRSGSKTVTIRSGEPAASSGVLSEGSFTQEMLHAHNNVRAETGLPPLQWSGELAAYSKKWANLLIAKNRTAHNAKSPYGENVLAVGLGSTPSSVVAEWASESQDYKYHTNTCNGDCGHYTQLVWRSTRKVGCAMARNSQREIWVCSYDPPGNFVGEWPY